LYFFNAFRNKNNRNVKFNLALNIESTEKNAYGSALGPDWAFDLKMKGKNEVIYYSKQIEVF
jgi:hypothetical protein